MPDYVLGLDLNDYRSGVDLRQAKRQGVRYVINKATEGVADGAHWIHDTLEEYRQKASDVLLPFGAYLYWRFAFDAVKQAELYLEHLGEVQFPPIVDVERINNRREGGGPLVSVQANVNHLRIVLDTIEEKTGLKPIIYTNWATWNEIFGNSTAFSDYKLWVANYGRSTPWLPVPWQPENWLIWQWTSSYAIDGYSRGVDANWFKGNEGEFEAYIASVIAQWHPPAPPVEPPPEVPPAGEVFVVGSILHANGNEELFVLTEGDQFTLKVQRF